MGSPPDTALLEREREAEVKKLTDPPEDLGPAVRRPPEAAALGMAYQVIISPEGERRFSFVGQRCLALNGVTAEAAMANPALLYEMILPEHRDAFASAEAEAIAAKQPFDIEVALRRADGEVRWHRIASMPRPLPDGSTAWDGLQIDVTDRRRIAAELEEQRRRLEVAVEATGLGFWEWDIEADKVTWSERNREIFEVAPESELTIARYIELVHPDDVAKVQQAYGDARAAGGGDFSVEHRVNLDSGELRWVLSQGRVISHDGEAKLVVGTTLDVTGRKAAEERRALLMGELAHRAKNGIAVVMAIVQQTARSSDTLEGFEELLISRLQSMATAQDLVTATGGRPVQLKDVVEKAMTPFGLGRFEIDDALAGVTIIGDIAVGLGLTLHEMATNAVKYGALSNNRGRVKIGRQDRDDGLVGLCWKEQDGPPVKPPKRQGFGSRVLEASLRTQGGKVEFSFQPKGFEARLEFPQAG
jgi:PAS domain S-box-containing protein